MSHHNFTSAARSLALPINDSDDEDLFPTQTRHSGEQSWRRRSQSGSPEAIRPRTTRDKWKQEAEKWQRRGMQMWFKFTPLQRAGIIVLDIVLIVLAILFVVYNERIFAWLSPAATSWRNLSGGWLILWFLTFFVAFPPLIGYSTAITVAGFVYGMNGWFVVATATVLGSTCSFVVSRTVLRNFVSRLTEKNKRFAALSLVLKHDGLKLLVMIRLCPLPYSLSNGAISTIPTIRWHTFAIATALATPKLLLGVFVGSRLGDLAENGHKMDTKTKIVSYISIAIGISAGIATGYLVYARTKARARQLEAEEAAAAVSGPRTSSLGSDFIDDPDEQEAVDTLRREADDISLHRTYSDDVEAGQYRDDSTDDEDAQERDVFDDGDGGDEVEEGKGKGNRGRR